MNKNPSTSRGGGKQQFIDAALTLAARKRSFASLGLRELAREAELNPNAFYRHFASLDDLGVCMTEEIGSQLQKALQQVIRQPFEPGDIIDQALNELFQFVLDNSDAVIVAACERFSGSAAVRESLDLLFETLRGDMAAAAQSMGILQLLQDDRVVEISDHIIHYCFRISVKFIENPRARPEIKRAAKRYILMLFSGALAFEADRQTAET